MKSLHTKFLLLIVLGVLLSSALIGATTIVISDGALSEEAALLMNRTCEKEAEVINRNLQETVFSVRVAELQAQNLIDDDIETFLSSSALKFSFSDTMQRTMLNIFRTTSGGTDSFYLYTDEETMEKRFGVYWTRVTDVSYRSVVPPSVAEMDERDPAYSWYFETVKADTALWVGPYTEKNGRRLLSYCMPLYVEGQRLGILGMDLDLTKLESVLGSIVVFDTGYAFLLDEDNKVIYHKSQAAGTHIDAEIEGVSDSSSFLTGSGTGNSLEYVTYKGVQKCLAYRKLDNGMKLVLCAPVAEKDATRTRMFWVALITAFAMATVCTVILIFLLRRLIRPLNELTEASKKIAREEFDVQLTYHGKDEVGILEDSFRATVENLKRYNSRMNSYVYRDPLTGVKSKRAFDEAVEQMNRRIPEEKPEFAVIVFDVNGLKNANDRYGHPLGDELIRQISDAISNVWKHSPIFRIGGDEFVAIVERNDYADREKLMNELDEELVRRNRELNFQTPISVAKGMAEFEPYSDTNFMDVFQRADRRMYEDKRKTKKPGNTAKD